MNYRTNISKNSLLTVIQTSHSLVLSLSRPLENEYSYCSAKADLSAAMGDLATSIMRLYVAVSLLEQDDFDDLPEGMMHRICDDLPRDRIFDLLFFEHSLDEVIGEINGIRYECDNCAALITGGIYDKPFYGDPNAEHRLSASDLL